jgi:hypothetical protein
MSLAWFRIKEGPQNHRKVDEGDCELLDELVVVGSRKISTDTIFPMISCYHITRFKFVSVKNIQSKIYDDSQDVYVHSLNFSEPNSKYTRRNKKEKFLYE